MEFHSWINQVVVTVLVLLTNVQLGKYFVQTSSY